MTFALVERTIPPSRPQGPSAAGCGGPRPDKGRLEWSLPACVRTSRETRISASFFPVPVNLTLGHCAEIRVEDDDIQTPKVPDGLSETSPRSAAGDRSSAGRGLSVRASRTAAASTLGGTLRGSIRRPRPPACGVRERRRVQWSSRMGRLSLLIY